MTGKIAGLVLAAGAGRRFGTPKALVAWGDGTLLDHAVGTLRSGGCEPVYAVLGASAQQAQAAATAEFLPVINSDWRSGMGSSLRAGLAVMPAGVPAVIVSLVDQPGVSATAVSMVRAAHADGARIAVATYDGRRGHPMLFDRSLWPEVAEHATGDVGARVFLTDHPEHIVEVNCTGTGDARDVDTPADWAAISRSLEDDHDA